MKAQYNSLVKCRMPTGESYRPTVISRAHEIEELIEAKCSMGSISDAVSEESDEAEDDENDSPPSDIDDKSSIAIETPSRSAPAVNRLRTPKEVVQSQTSKRDHIFNNLSSMIDAPPTQDITESIKELSMIQFFQQQLAQAQQNAMALEKDKRELELRLLKIEMQMQVGTRLGGHDFVFTSGPSCGVDSRRNDEAICRSRTPGHDDAL